MERRNRTFRDRVLRISGWFMLLVILSAVWGPSIVKLHNGFDYDTQDLHHRLEGISSRHPLGTDILGRDLLVRLLYGSRVSLFVGVVATLVSAFIGIVYGAVSGYFGGKTDGLMMRIVDILYSLPFLVLVILLLALFEKSIVLLFVALGAVSWLTIARIVRGQVLMVKNERFVEAARALGSSHFTILFRHVIPNTFGVVVAYVTLTIPSIILQEAFLSFLGLGVPPPIPSLGVLANEGAQVIAIHPILLIAPALFIALTLFGLNILGDSLRLRFSQAAS